MIAMSQALKKATLMMRMPKVIDEHAGSASMPRTTAYNMLIRRGLAVRQIFRFYSQLGIRGEKLTEYGMASMDYAGYVMAKYDEYYKESKHSVISKTIALDESTLSVIRQLTEEFDVTVRPTNIGMAGMCLGLGFIHDIELANDMDAIDDLFSKDAVRLSRMARRVWSAADLDILENPGWSASDLERHVIRESELLGMVCSDAELMEKTNAEIQQKRPTAQDVQNPELLEQLNSEKNNDKRTALIRKLQRQYAQAGKVAQEYDKRNYLGWSEALW